MPRPKRALGPVDHPGVRPQRIMGRLVDQNVMTGPVHAQHRRGLCRTGGKHHLGGLAPDGLGHLRARRLDRCLGRAPLGVHRGRIARQIERRDHRLARLAPQRRRGVMIEIDPHTAPRTANRPMLHRSSDTHLTRQPACRHRHPISPPPRTATARQDRGQACCPPRPTAVSGAGIRIPARSAPPTGDWSATARGCPTRRRWHRRRCASH